MAPSSTSKPIPNPLYSGDDWRFSIPLVDEACNEIDLTHAELWILLKTTMSAEVASHVITSDWDDDPDAEIGLFRVKVDHAVTKTITPGLYYLEVKRVYRSQEDDSILDIATLYYDDKTPSLTVRGGIDLESITL